MKFRLKFKHGSYEIWELKFNNFIFTGSWNSLQQKMCEIQEGIEMYRRVGAI